MTIFKDYTKSGKLIEVRDVPVTTQNAARYLYEYGSDCMEGYKDCLTEIVNKFGPAVWEEYYDSDFLDNNALNAHMYTTRNPKFIANAYKQQAKNLTNVLADDSHSANYNKGYTDGMADVFRELKPKIWKYYDDDYILNGHSNSNEDYLAIPTVGIYFRDTSPVGIILLEKRELLAKVSSLLMGNGQELTLG